MDSELNIATLEKSKTLRFFTISLQRHFDLQAGRSVLDRIDDKIKIS